MTVVPDQVDLALDITALSPNPAVLGVNTASYLVHVINNNNGNPAVGTNVLITDTLPMSSTFVTATIQYAGTGSCQQASGVVTCSLTALGPGSNNYVTIVVSPTALGVLTDTATTSADQVDPNPANNVPVSAAVTVVPDQVDLALDITALAPNPAVLGVNTASYLVHVINNNNGNPAVGTNVLITDTLPISSTFITATIQYAGTGSCQQASGVVTCSLTALGPGSNNYVTIVVSPTALGVLTDTATTSADQVDPNPANSVPVSAAVTVVPDQVDLALDVTALAPNPAVLGVNTASYLVHVINNNNGNPAVGTNVLITDTLPISSTFITATIQYAGTGSCQQASGVVTCSLTSLGAGSNNYVTIVVSPTALGVLTDTATTSADQVDPNPANNMAAAAVTVISGLPSPTPSGTATNTPTTTRRQHQPELPPTRRPLPKHRHQLPLQPTRRPLPVH